MYRTNKYTAGYQNLVDSYGVNSYREVGFGEKRRHNTTKTAHVPEKQHCLKLFNSPSAFGPFGLF